MKTFTQLIKDINEAKYEWPASLTPGTKEYKAKQQGSKDGDGSRHKIEKEPGIVRATRKYDADSGESEEPTKNRENAAEAPVKRGRGRPPGKYGSYKKKLKESLEILESLETQEEIEEFISSLDQESFEELEAHIDEELHPNQRVLDKNKNNKLDKEDFKMLRGEKKAKMEEVDLDEGWKEKVAGVALGAAAIGGIGAAIHGLPPTHIDGVRHELALKTPENAKLTTDDKGRKVHVWTSKSTHPKRNQIHRFYRPAEKVKEQGVAEEVDLDEEQIDESVNRYAAFIATENK